MGGKDRRKICCSVVFRWGHKWWTYHTEVEVLQNHPPLNLAPMEHAYGVGDGGQSGVDCQLTPTLACNPVEDEVKSVYRQPGKNNIPCLCHSELIQSRGVRELPNVNESNQMGRERTITYGPLGFFIFSTGPSQMPIFPWCLLDLSKGWVVFLVVVSRGYVTISVGDCGGCNTEGG